MLTKTVKYTDFNDNEISEEFCFNMTEAEVVEMEVGYKRGYSAHLQAIIDAKNSKDVVEVVKSLILKSYGQKSNDDGVLRFVKSDELSLQFSQSEAYSVLFMELSADADHAAEFFLALLPKSVRAKIPQDKPLSPPNIPAPPQPSA
jgi:hypothetical protein